MLVIMGLASENLLSKIKFFNIQMFQPDLSDHCQILLSKINCNVLDNNDHVQSLFNSYKWDENSLSLLQDALATPDLQSKMQSINDSNYENIDNLVKDINTVLWEAAELSLKKINREPKLKEILNKNKNYLRNIVEILL